MTSQLSRKTYTQFLKAGRLNAVPNSSSNLHHDPLLQTHTHYCSALQPVCCYSRRFHVLIPLLPLLCSPVQCSPALTRFHVGVWLSGCNSSRKSTSGQTSPDSRWCIWVRLVSASFELKALLNIF